MTSVPQAVGVDVGGTSVRALRMDASGEVLARAACASPASDPDATLAAILEVIEAVRSPEVGAAGLAAAGMVEHPGGTLRFAPNLAWRDLELRAWLSDQTGLVAWVENDNTAACWGEVRFGAARGRRDVLFVGVGTGIGGGIVSGGLPVRGAHGFAAEIGHMVVEPDGPECGCGNRGCWEQVASGSTIVRDGRAAATRHPHSLLAELAAGDPDHVTGEMVTEAARAGDPTARGILVEVGHRLGVGIAGLVNVLDPEEVVVGGGVSAAGELLLGPARAAMEAAVESGRSRPGLELLGASLGIDAGAVGAAALALESP